MVKLQECETDQADFFIDKHKYRIISSKVIWMKSHESMKSVRFTSLVNEKQTHLDQHNLIKYVLVIMFIVWSVLCVKCFVISLPLGPIWKSLNHTVLSENFRCVTSCGSHFTKRWRQIVAVCSLLLWSTTRSVYMLGTHGLNEMWVSAWT